MINTPDEVERVFAGTALEHCDVESVQYFDQSLLLLSAESMPVLPTWEVARKAISKTGRWPLMVADFGADLNDDSQHNRSFYAANDDDDLSPAGVLARAEAVDPVAAVASLAKAADQRWPLEDGDIKGELEKTRDTYGDAPSLQEIKQGLGASIGLYGVDRWLFDYECGLADNGSSTPDPYTGHLGWYEPGDDGVFLLLLPTEHSWQVPAWVDFYGAEGPGGHELLIAAMRMWHEKWGAELVANWLTMLQLIVTRPPSTPQEAYETALAHEVLAGSTLGPSGVSVREHARALVGRENWFLHDRP